MPSDTPRTVAEMNRVFAELDGGEDNALYALEQMGVLSRQLERELAAAIKERDEARREVCRHMSMRSACLGVHCTSREHAIALGWDCYGQKQGGRA